MVPLLLLKIPLAFGLWKIIYFIGYRFAAWSGTLWLYRKGKREHKRELIFLSVLVYVASWATIFLGTSLVVRWIEQIIKYAFA